MVKKKILITGGSGYIGSRLSLYLSQKGFDIIPLCNSKIPDNKEWIQSMYLVLQGDLIDKATLNKIKSLKPDAIIHLVSLDHNQSGINIEETMRVNVQSTWELLSLSESLGLDKFIYFSTTQVYGKTSEKVVTENTKLNPINPYGLTHKMSEDLVDFYRRSKNLDAVSLRLSNSYGEPVFHDLNCWSLVVNDLCLAAFNYKKIVLKSDGSATRDFIHFSTICNSVENLLKEKSLSRKSLNLCSGESISLLALALEVKHIYENKFKESVEVFINNTKLCLEDKSHYKVNGPIISNESLRKQISFKYLGIQKGILQLFNYLENRST